MQVRHKRDNVIELLHQAGAHLAASSSGTAICEAAAKNDVQGLMRLIENGVDPNTCDWDHRSPLQLGASNGCVDAVAYLLSKPGLQVNYRDQYGGTALEDAIRNKHQKVQELLLQARAASRRRLLPPPACCWPGLLPCA